MTPAVRSDLLLTAVTGRKERSEVNTSNTSARLKKGSRSVELARTHQKNAPFCGALTDAG